ncbi:uncharacterized protein LOC109724202 [Ananas comosus]|uniref:Uncharacterized protein LOC109724202 n=1 Tax=Ananas comosus TaxID=4615 RepID=A0A6P5GST1_ANACO|nr:uncharacterized protein LOC109724202 [Ananas comosus]
MGAGEVRSMVLTSSGGGEWRRRRWSKPSPHQLGLGLHGNGSHSGGRGAQGRRRPAGQVAGAPGEAARPTQGGGDPRGEAAHRLRLGSGWRAGGCTQQERRRAGELRYGGDRRDGSPGLRGRRRGRLKAAVTCGERLHTGFGSARAGRLQAAVAATAALWAARGNGGRRPNVGEVPPEWPKAAAVRGEGVGAASAWVRPRLAAKCWGSSGGRGSRRISGGDAGEGWKGRDTLPRSRAAIGE